MPAFVDTPQQKAALRQSATARKVRARFPAGTRVTPERAGPDGEQGTVVRHVPQTNAQGGYLTVQWDNGTVGRISACSLKVVG